MIGPRYISQVTFGDQTAGNNRSGPDYLLFRFVCKVKGIMIGVDADTINLNRLADIARDDIGIVAILFQVIILLFGRSIGQV